MKNTRRFIAGFSAMAMAAAMAMSASAVDPTQIVSNDSGSPTPETAGAEVSYNVDPSYTVIIPAGADISSGSDVQSIKANDVLLEQGQKITVTLFKASNTESGKSFSAKDESGESTVKYTIKAGDTDVAVGDKVAEFETKTGEQSATLTFTKDADSTPTFAGTHTETLTFGISVEDASITFTVKRAGVGTDGTYTVAPGTTWQQFIASGDAPACLKIYNGKVWHDMDMSIMDCGGTLIANTADNKYVKSSDVIIDGATYGCDDYIGYDGHD